jgi:dynein heavy chain
LDLFIKNFPSLVHPLADGLVAATVELYLSLTVEFLPTPTKSHYVFNMRDISKVFQSILSVAPECIHINNYLTFTYYSAIYRREQMIRLWLHECRCVFGDRLIDGQDRKSFEASLTRIMKLYFNPDDYQKVDVNDKLLFGDFLAGESSATRSYVESKDPTHLRNIIQGYLEDYNIVNSPSLQLVFFDYAIEHVVKVS